MARWAESTRKLIIVAGWRAMFTSWMSITIVPMEKSPWSVRRNNSR